MRGDRQGITGTFLGRRPFLRAVGVGAASLTMAGTASADQPTYDRVIDIVEEGADNTGVKSINPVLENVRHDSLLIKFPEGKYKMDRQFRHTNFNVFGMVGDNATIVPVPAGEWNDDERRLFRLGTYANPGGDLRIQNFTFDFTAPNTGLRAIETQVASPFIRRVRVKGRHDTGNWAQGPMLVDVTDPDGTGRVERVHLTGGGMYVKHPDHASFGPIGFAVSPYHRGTLEVFACNIFDFPSNGFYCSSVNGTVVVRKGRYRNSNIANIRLAGQNSQIKGATVVVRKNPAGWTTQRGIRLDGGGDFLIDGVRMWHPRPNGEAIVVTNGARDTRIRNAKITMGNGKSDAISVSNHDGVVDILDSTITKNGRGQAIQIDPATVSPVLVRDVRITGDAPGGDGGSHAIRCEREYCEFRQVTVDQPGPHRRRCFIINGDRCLVVGGRYKSTHHPIVVDADHVELWDVTARAYDGAEGIKVLGGHDNIDVANSTIWNRIENRGSDVATEINNYPVS